MPVHKNASMDGSREWEGKREQRSGMSHIAAAGKEPLASPTTEWTDRWTKLYWPLHANLWATASMLAQLSETLALDYASLNSRDGMEISSSSMPGIERRKHAQEDCLWLPLAHIDRSVTPLLWKKWLPPSSKPFPPPREGILNRKSESWKGSKAYVPLSVKGFLY